MNSLGDCDPVDFFYQSTSDPNFHDSPEICPDYQEDVQNIAVKGRLRRNISFWEYIGASWFIRQTILEGYKIPFYFTPAPATFGNNKSSLQHADFVHKAITDLLAVGSVVECSSPPSVINPLSVSIQSNGKKRLILDLRYPNSFVKKFTIKFEDALSHTTMPARQLASVTGSIISNMLVIGNLCKLMTKNLHRALDCRAGWESSVILDLPSRKELIFWRENLFRLNSRPLSEDVRPVTRIAYSDASSLGCAAYLSMDDFPVAHKNWDPLEMSQSSTWRELHCVYFALQSFALRLSISSVKWFTDNQAVPIIVDSGSMKEELHKLSVDIFYVTRDYNIDLDVEWIPRSLNDKADYLSKIVDCDDWKVKDCYFYALTSYWGQCSVDCFASSKNCKVPRFYSRFYNPYCLGVDSFAFSWAGEFCWLVPPVTLVTRVIRHVCLCKCKGILVIPYWPSAPFWPLLVDSQGSFNLFVIDYLFVENGKDVFLHGSNKNAIFGSENFSTPVLFLLLDGAL